MFYFFAVKRCFGYGFAHNKPGRVFLSRKYFYLFNFKFLALHGNVNVQTVGVQINFFLCLHKTHRTNGKMVISTGQLQPEIAFRIGDGPLFCFGNKDGGVRNWFVLRPQNSSGNNLSRSLVSKN